MALAGGDSGALQVDFLMPRSLNKVLLIGYIADEPTVRDFPNGNKVARATLVTNELARNPETGGSDEQPEWHRLTFWGNLANTVEGYVHKGTRLYAEGRLKTRNYVDREGIKRYATEIVCDNMIMLDSRRGDGSYQSNNNFNGNAGGMGEGYTPINQANTGRANNFGPANNNGNGGNFGAAPMPTNFNGQRNGSSYSGQNGAPSQGSNFNMAPSMPQPQMPQSMPQPQMPQQPQRGYQSNAAMNVNNFGGNHGNFGAPNSGMPAPAPVPAQGMQSQPAPSANNFGGAPVNNFGQQPKAPSPAAGQNFTVPTGPAGNNGDDDIPF